MEKMDHLVDILDEKTFLELQNIFDNKIEDKVSESNFFENWDMSKYERVRVNMSKSETSRKIINIANKFFQKAGLTVNENNGYIEYVSYLFNKSNYKKDDYDYVYRANENYDGVHECVIIIRKDEGIKGGNLEIYSENPNTFSRFIGFDNDLPDKLSYSLKPGMVFVCDGSVIHQYLNCGGYGQYDIINVTLYSYKRVGYKYDNDDD